MSQKLLGLGEYKSIWDGVEDPMLKELIGRELRRDHRRSIKQIKRAAVVKYWIHILRWTLEDIRIYVPLIGLFALGILLILIALS